MGKLTTHVLDTAAGIPGAGIAIQLFRCEPARELVVTTETNDDGRCDSPLLDGEDFADGTYELVFDIESYFAGRESTATSPPFLDRITLRFTISENKHYHVPLLVSPWSYSTYRGS